MRTPRGQSTVRRTGLFTPETVKNLNDNVGKKTSYFNDTLRFGADFRFQTARSHKSKDSNRRFFPMQAALYSTYKFNDTVNLEASYNLGPKKFFGQQKWTASIIVHPFSSKTQLRAGYFQPSIGIRYDDHTVLIRQCGGADGTTLIAPNYAEYGAELMYNGIEWLTLTGGIFDAASLSENSVVNKSGTVVSLIGDKHTPSALGRLELHHRVYDRRITLNGGSSLLTNDDFYLLNVFSGMGLQKRLSVMVEYSRSVKKDLRTTNNISVDFTFKLLDPLLLSLRGERAETTETFSGVEIETYTNQGVIGTQIFIIPSVVLRPEYRLVDTERYRSTRYAVQLHIFH